MGAAALTGNTTGFGNTANGFQALQSNTSGSGNTATGVAALSSNTVAVENTAIGFNALAANIDGANNTAVGSGALVNSNGDFNTALGLGALSNNTTGGSNIALGRLAGTGVATASNVICIGALVDGADVNDSCYIGNIHGQTVDSGTGLSVFVDSAGKLGTTLSSRRFKRDIQPMDKSSEVVLALKPVTFYYKTDANGTPQFGLLAEDVADVDPDLVVRDRDGELLSVRYDQVNAMLLNEFIKEHRKMEEQQNEISALKAELKEQRDLIQQVSEKLKMTKPAELVINNL
jgi:Chaperone of endosialidase